MGALKGMSSLIFWFVMPDTSFGEISDTVTVTWILSLSDENWSLYLHKGSITFGNASIPTMGSGYLLKAQVQGVSKIALPLFHKTVMASLQPHENLGMVTGIFCEEFLAVALGGGLYRGVTLLHWYFTALGIVSSPRHFFSQIWKFSLRIRFRDSDYPIKFRDVV